MTKPAKKEIPTRCNCGCGIPPIVVLFVPKTFVLVRDRIVLFAQHQDFVLERQKPKGNLFDLRREVSWAVYPRNQLPHTHTLTRTQPQQTSVQE